MEINIRKYRNLVCLTGSGLWSLQLQCMPGVAANDMTHEMEAVL